MPHGQGGRTAEEEIARAQALVKASRRERELTAEAFGFYQADTLLATPQEIVPKHWEAEADRRGFWKLFQE